MDLVPEVGMCSWGLSAVEQDEVWQRWRRGESLRLIARRLGKRGPSVRAFVLQAGGVQCPLPRRAARALLLAEREEISRGLAAGDSCRMIAQRLGRAPSTVSREVVGNGDRRRYRAQVADGAADRRARRPKAVKLVLQPRLGTVVALPDGYKAALHDRGCSCGLNPPVSSSDLAMYFARLRKPRAEPWRCSRRPLIASVGPLGRPTRLADQDVSEPAGVLVVAPIDD